MMAKKVAKVVLSEEEKQAQATKSLYATADFEIEKLGVRIAEGEEFTPPAGWVRDLAQEELLLASRVKQGGQVGMVFAYDGEIINPHERNPQLRERRTHNVVLPLELR
jgi:hypothetical protein